MCFYSPHTSKYEEIIPGQRAKFIAECTHPKERTCIIASSSKGPFYLSCDRCLMRPYEIPAEDVKDFYKNYK